MDQRQLTELERGESLLGALRFVLLSKQVISELVSACRGFIFPHTSNSVKSQAESSFHSSLSTDQINWYQFSFSVTKYLSIIPVQKLEMNLPVLCWELWRATELTTAGLHAAWRATSAPKRVQAAGGSAGFLPCRAIGRQAADLTPLPPQGVTLLFISVPDAPSLREDLSQCALTCVGSLEADRLGPQTLCSSCFGFCLDFPSF